MQISLILIYMFFSFIMSWLLTSITIFYFKLYSGLYQHFIPSLNNSYLKICETLIFMFYFILFCKLLDNNPFYR